MDSNSSQEVSKGPVGAEQRFITDDERKLITAAMGLVAARDDCYRRGYGVPIFERPEIDAQLNNLVGAVVTVRKAMSEELRSQNPDS